LHRGFDAEDDLTRGINGHEVARAAAKILDPANTLCFPSCENISPHITVPGQFKYRVLTKDELYARVPQLGSKREETSPLITQTKRPSLRLTTK
jgi:hypothetical protein